LATSSQTIHWHTLHEKTNGNRRNFLSRRSFLSWGIVTSILIVSIVVSIYTVRAGGEQFWSPNLAILVFSALRTSIATYRVVTEADWDGWTESDLHPFIDVVLECFGSKRLMFGSDRPVSLVTWPYKKWIEVVERATNRFQVLNAIEYVGHRQTGLPALDARGSRT
jgi:hypothetical protein